MKGLNFHKTVENVFKLNAQPDVIKANQATTVVLYMSSCTLFPENNARHIMSCVNNKQVALFINRRQ
jgi:hypothetical protein